MTETTPPSRPVGGDELAQGTIDAMSGTTDDRPLDPAAERARVRVRFAVETLQAARRGGST